MAQPALTPMSDERWEELLEGITPRTVLEARLGTVDMGPVSRFADQVPQHFGQGQQHFGGDSRHFNEGCMAPQGKAGMSRVKVVTATCSLTSATRFEVVAPYHAPLIDMLKQLASAQYRASDRAWTFALAEHDLLQQKVRGLFPAVKMSPLPLHILATFLRPSTAEPSAIDLSPVEAHLLDQLMPFQREGVQYGVSRKGRVLIADDMGLGKTVEALALASYYRAAWPVLVVAPSSMRFAWQAAVLRWLPTVGPQDISVITTGKDFIGDSQVVVISYDLLKKKGGELARKDYQFVILDESHMVKEAKTGRYKAVEPLARGAAHLVLLSGTPALARPIELFTQVRLIDPNFYTNKKEFGVRYCDYKLKSIGRLQKVDDYSGASNTTELALLLKRHCMVKRTKEDVLPELLPKKRRKVELAVGREHLDQDMEERRAGAVHEGRQELLGQLYPATARVKLPAVLEHLRGLLEEGRRFLVFCHHKTMLEGVADMLDQQGVDFIKIDGKVGSKERMELVDRFQTVDKVKVAVLSITAANAGITLTAAHLVVFAELFWNPGDLLQAEDRAHRIGQTHSVICQYLVAKGTADDQLWPMVQGKLEVLGQVGLTRETFGEMEE